MNLKELTKEEIAKEFYKAGVITAAKTLFEYLEAEGIEPPKEMGTQVKYLYDSIHETN